MAREIWRRVFFTAGSASGLLLAAAVLRGYRRYLYKKFKKHADRSDLHKVLTATFYKITSVEDPDPEPHVFGFPAPDPFVGGTDPDPDPDPHQNVKDPNTDNSYGFNIS